MSYNMDSDPTILRVWIWIMVNTFTQIKYFYFRRSEMNWKFILQQNRIMKDALVDKKTLLFLINKLHLTRQTYLSVEKAVKGLGRLTVLLL